MRIKLVIGAVVASMMMAGCGSSDTKKENVLEEERFTQMTIMNDVVDVDSKTKLEWVASAGNGACAPHAAATTQMADIASAEAHCSALVFAGHEDWRVATASEHSEFIKCMMDDNKTPFYLKPGCLRLIGSDGTTAMAVNTHNSTPVGDMTPWTELISSGGSSSFGIKCVRKQ